MIVPTATMWIVSEYAVILTQIPRGAAAKEIAPTFSRLFGIWATNGSIFRLDAVLMKQCIARSTESAFAWRLKLSPDRIGLGHYYCFVDVLPAVLSKKLPTASANCCGTVSMALCC